MFWIFLLVIIVVAMYLVRHMAKKAHLVHSGAYGQPYNQGNAQPAGQSYDQTYGQQQPYVQDAYNPVIDNSLDNMQQGYAAPHQYSDAIRSAAPTPAAPTAPASPQMPVVPGFDPNNPYLSNGYNPNKPLNPDQQ